jgi:hypothetical protein
MFSRCRRSPRVAMTSVAGGSIVARCPWHRSQGAHIDEFGSDSFVDVP